MHMKYKIWDKEQKKWYEPIYEAYKGRLKELFLMPCGSLAMRTYSAIIHESVFPDRYEIVWFTGLLDKNEREIWEGDILQRHSALVPKGSDPYVKSVVEWGEWRWDGIDGWSSAEVIGNIYENPELIA